MPQLDLRGFNVPEQDFGGLYQAANTLERQRKEDQQLTEQKVGRQAATSKFLTDYLDPKDHLTGTNYDPQIVGGFQNILQQAQQLAGRGASTNDILMAIGPSVAKLNDYSTKAKLISQNIKNTVAKLKTYPGYNVDALETEAKKTAFYGPDGKLKDISTVDPNENYVSMVAQNSPELITSGKGLDDFVNKTPMADYSRSATTTYAGRSKNVKYEAKHPFWEDLQRDQNGNIATDQSGNPLGLGVSGTSMMDDSGKPIVNSQTGQPFQVMDKNNFNAIMSHNPDVADYIRGQVNQHFRDAGAKQLPAENSPQWDMMARHILHDELETRKRSTFRTIDQQKETLPAIKVEIGNNPDMLEATAKYQEANKLKGEYSIGDANGKPVKTNVVQTIGKIFSNDPAYVQGAPTQLEDGRSVIDVTESFPKEGLKTAKNESKTPEAVYYDPTKRSLIIKYRTKSKNPTTKDYDYSAEEIPESKAGQYMMRIAGANGVDPSKVSGMLDQLGYKSAKFNNIEDAKELNDRLGKNTTAKTEEAIKNVEDDNFDALKDVPVKDGKIIKVENRNMTGWLPGRSRYAIQVQTPDGKTKQVNFNDKEEMKKYIQGISAAPKVTKEAPKQPDSPLIDALKKPSSKGILD